MTSPRNALMALALLLAASLCAGAATTPTTPTAPALPASSAAAAPAPEQVRQATEHVRADPLLSHIETRKMFRLKKRGGDNESSDGWDWSWLTNAVRWVASSLRALVWLLGAGLAAFVLLRLVRWARVRGQFTAGTRAAPLPSHVQNLDIRPESLPDDIGAAAAALWQGGQQRAALSLLYRGALSRLVHGYALPIRAASTEGECLALADARLDAPRARFFARLVGVWLPAVYGARMPQSEQALALCRDFNQNLTGAPAAAAGGAA